MINNTLPKFYIFPIVYLVMLISCPIAFAALEKSSKKECAMCHVMWLDEFRTNQETLIEWQPGNVLMKDTQGVVSSEEICYSCHDGYVEDSRHIVWKDHNHTTFKKPSESMKIPQTFTLSNKDEIYCGTCHTPHSGQEAVSGTPSDKSIPGPISFLRVANTDSGLCEACHVNQADYKKSKGHPVHTDKLKIPETLFELGSVKAQQKDTVTCQTCHKVHGAKGQNLTVMDNTQSALCMACHDQRTIAGTQHDLSLTLPTEKNIKGQTAAESGQCGACHIPHNSAGSRLWARKMDPGKSFSQVCLSCHSGEPESKIKGIGQYSHPNNIAAVSKEGRKTARSNFTEKLPFFSLTGEVQSSGMVQCFTCHNIHQWDPASSDNRGGKDAEGDGGNSFLRISNSRSSALCVECHRDKRPILSNDHNLAVTAPEAKNIQGITAAVSGPCGACHIPHNAAGENLWARNLTKDNNNSSLQYCTECHAENGVAKEKPVGKNDHPVNLASKGPRISPSGKVSAMLPLYSETGRAEEGDRIMCLTCHDPHIWSAAGRKIVPKDESAVSASAQLQNIEGDARNSFLRKVASPSPDLCVVCHEETAMLIGTDHDLFVTAPSAKNLRGQTAAESGQCGVCHSAHNSPKDRLLWAREYGPVAENQHPMNGVCTGCHSKGGVAEDKISSTATHPPGQLINNIMTHNNQATGYIKLFDANWKETDIGDLSCSSCHSFYQWDHRVRQQGPGKNIEGDADTSFLRTSSEKIVCIDCHGETALWRYTYFHSVKKKEMLKDRQLQ